MANSQPKLLLVDGMWGDCSVTYMLNYVVDTEVRDNTIQNVFQ